jgi:hypothetical protein
MDKVEAEKAEIYPLSEPDVGYMVAHRLAVLVTAANRLALSSRVAIPTSHGGGKPPIMSDRTP